MILRGASSMDNIGDQSVILIEEFKDFGLIIIKANFLDRRICDDLSAATGVEVPKAGKISFGKKLSVGWMSTDEYAIILQKSEANKICNRIKVKLKKYDHLCINMSDSRRCFRLVLGEVLIDVGRVDTGLRASETPCRTLLDMCF